ncbi:hypothetical protein SOV_44480 [Sporomusa ovata DSM 2662]|uniref:Uncharacterized protein n=1 Tax=Sporomusa ovata TaxID=2378 RepID=A0A0U1KU36_9FIRM|nr:hypothetical protein SOV_3c07100 [Sporomusa ovata DSM 2662]CQR70936.1 hypothetical protein SpAn4DRAFT_1914 [Sporomusa ovata]
MIATASWEWCEPALSNIMKIIRELRAELISRLRRVLFREIAARYCGEVSSLTSVPMSSYGY